MAFGQGPFVRVAYLAEVTKGVTPGSGTWKTLRATDRNINLVKDTFESNEVNVDRNVHFMRHGMNRVEGPLVSEVALQAYDDWFEAALGGTWAAVTTSGTPNLAAAATTNLFTRAAGSFVTDGYRAGDIVTVTGFSNAANNGTHQIIEVTTTTLKSTSSLVTEASAGSRTIALTGKRLDIGTTMRTFSVEKQYVDINQFKRLAGVTPNVVDVRIQPGGIVTVSWGGLGMSGIAMTPTIVNVPDPAPQTDPMTAFEGTIYEGTVLQGAVTGLNIRVDNRRQLTGVVGSKFSPDIFEGTTHVTGDASLFLQDEVFYNKFFNETLSSIYCKLSDLSGGFLNFVVPSLKYTGNTDNPPREGGIVQEAPYRGLYSTAAPTSISIQRSNV